MKISNLYQAIKTGIAITEDYKKSVKQVERDIEYAKSRGMVYTQEKMQEFSDKKEQQRQSALKQLVLLRADYETYLKDEKQLLPFGIDKDGVPASFTSSELRFLESLKYMNLTPEMFEGYLKIYAKDASNPAMVSALTNMATLQGYRVEGVDTRNTSEKMAEFDQIIDKLAKQLQPETWYSDNFNAVSAQIFLDEVNEIAEREYAGNRNAIVDGITVTDPETEKADALGVVVIDNPEPEISAETDRAIKTGLLGKEAVEKEEHTEAVARAQMVKRQNAEAEAERRKAEAQEKAIMQAKIEAEVKAELEAKAEAEAK